MADSQCGMASFESPSIFTCTPYAMGPRWKRKKYSDEDTVWEDNKVESELGLVAENGTLGSWFKVTFHYDKHRARFFVQNARTAYALRDINNKLRDETNQKISIFISPSVVPYSVQSKFTSEEIKQLKMTVMKRYDASQKSLDLERFRFDKDFMDNDIDVMLNRRSCMVATLQIIQSSIPELKTVWELEKVKELNLEELWLEGNPFCSHFSDQSDYISAIQDIFPKLLRLVKAHFIPPGISRGNENPASLALFFPLGFWVFLDIQCHLPYVLLTSSSFPQDGKELIVPTGMDIEVPQLSKGSDHRNKLSPYLILFTLTRYYSFYDKERFRLLDAYHDEACFSLTVSSNFNDPDLICIMNDKLIVRNTRTREIQNAFIPANSPLSEEQQEMVKSFSVQSRMKLTWAQK
ncbi:Nuclear RNA export factor 2 [Microtus ochrogaster]|uniref:Nuclear RNA export factor 2 n=1 Tax=Microtus ochrogaster TaxID=79684 RepID=A0A8J6FV08_MICOH|nr:Nuclear RNA export factor 2 [Microtus ochrogaster]